MSEGGLYECKDVWGNGFEIMKELFCSLGHSPCTHHLKSFNLACIHTGHTK